MKIGWAEHELLWLQAANALPHGKRYNALVDISNMTGRTFAAVNHQAYLMRTTVDALTRKPQPARAAQALFRQDLLLPLLSAMRPIEEAPDNFAWLVLREGDQVFRGQRWKHWSMDTAVWWSNERGQVNPTHFIGPDAIIAHAEAA